MSVQTEERPPARQNEGPSTSTTSPHHGADHSAAYRQAPTPIARSARIARRLLIAAPSVAHRRADTIPLGGHLVALLVLDAPTPRWVRRDRIRVAHRAHRPAVAA